MKKVFDRIAKRLKFSSLRVRLQVLVWVAIIPTLLLIVLGGLWYRGQEEAEVRAEVAGMVSLSKNSLDGYIDDVRHLLLTISHTDVIQKGNPASISSFFRDIHKHFPEHTNFGVVDLKGNVFASALEMKKPVNGSDLFYFQQVLKTRAFTVGEYQIGRITGLPIIIFAQPVFEDTGRMRFILFISMDIKGLSRFGQEGVKALPDAHFVITDRNGTILFHYPDNEKWAGRNRPDMPLVKAMLAQKEGGMEAVCEDGIKRIYAFIGIGAQESNIHIAIGISKKAAFEQTNKILIFEIVFLILAAAIGISLARLYSSKFIMKPIKALQNAAEGFVSGDYSCRINLSDGENELIAFTKVFDKMAETIEQESATRENAEELLQATNSRNQAMINAIPDLMFRINRAGVFLDYKPADSISTYVPPSDFIGKNIQDVMPREIARQAICFIEQALQTGKMQVFEYQLIMKGEERSYEARIVSCGKDEVLAIVRDTTERKQSDKVIQEQRKRIEAFFDHTITPMAFLDRDVNFIRVNKAYADAGKRDVSEFPGHNHFEYYPSDAKSIFEEVVRSKTAFQTFARPFLYADHPEWGVTYWDWTLVPILDSNGEVDFLVFSLVDVTKGKKTEALIENILESVDEGFIIIDPEYRIISANRAYCKQMKSSDCDIIGRHCYEVSHHIEKPCFTVGEVCAPMHTFKTGEPTMAVHTHYDAENNPVYIETKSFPMKDASGKITAVIETLNNITDQKKLEEQLRQAQKMEAVGTLAGGVAHDFNNILSAIIGYGHLSLMKMKPDDPIRTNIDQILTCSQRAAALTQSLLLFSRKSVINPVLLDLNELLQRFEKFIMRLIREDIEFTCSRSEGTLPIMADSGQIEQAIMNLVTNARDAMPEGGRLLIETDRTQLGKDFVDAHGYGVPGEFALVSITDTGIGMDETTKAHIFEPFFTTKEVGKGTGLGLAMVYGIVKKHDGYISVYSEPGKGTTFKIYLPIVEKNAALEEAHKEEPTQSLEGTETILLAEDDEPVRRLTKTVLENFGYTVIEAADGEDAINKFIVNKDRIQLAILDAIMPKKNGGEVFREITAMKPGFPVLFMSGYPAEIVGKQGVLEPGIKFVPKPISPLELLKKVREMLGK